VFNGVCDDCDSAAGIGIYELKSANLCTKYWSLFIIKVIKSYF
jgi:hypothetical protein